MHHDGLRLIGFRVWGNACRKDSLKTLLMSHGERKHTYLFTVPRRRSAFLSASHPSYPPGCNYNCKVGFPASEFGNFRSRPDGCYNHKRSVSRSTVASDG